MRILHHRAIFCWLLVQVRFSLPQVITSAVYTHTTHTATAIVEQVLFSLYALSPLHCCLHATTAGSPSCLRFCTVLRTCAFLHCCYSVAAAVLCRAPIAAPPGFVVHGSLPPLTLPAPLTAPLHRSGLWFPRLWFRIHRSFTPFCSSFSALRAAHLSFGFACATSFCTWFICGALWFTLGCSFVHYTIPRRFLPASPSLPTFFAHLILRLLDFSHLVHAATRTPFVLATFTAVGSPASLRFWFFLAVLVLCHRMPPATWLRITAVYTTCRLFSRFYSSAFAFCWFIQFAVHCTPFTRLPYRLHRSGFCYCLVCRLSFALHLFLQFFHAVLPLHTPPFTHTTTAFYHVHRTAAAFSGSLLPRFVRFFRTPPYAHAPPHWFHAVSLRVAPVLHLPLPPLLPVSFSSAAVRWTWFSCTSRSARSPGLRTPPSRLHLPPGSPRTCTILRLPTSRKCCASCGSVAHLVHLSPAAVLYIRLRFLVLRVA